MNEDDKLNKKHIIGIAMEAHGNMYQNKKHVYPEINMYYRYRKICNELGLNIDIRLINRQGKYYHENLDDGIEGYYKDLNLDFVIHQLHPHIFDSYNVAWNNLPLEYIRGETACNIAYLHNADAQSVLIKDTIAKGNYYNLPEYFDELYPEKPLNFTVLIDSAQRKIDADLASFKNPQLAYLAGINAASRYPDLIDYLDATGYTNFYGGKDAWKSLNLKSYRGRVSEEKLYQTLHNHGVVLALHSPQHRLYETYTHRVFEGITAGCAIIVEEYSTLKNVFGDSLFYIDHNQRQEDVFIQIDNIMKWIDTHPEETLAKVQHSQQILEKRFAYSPEKHWLMETLDQVEEYKEHHRAVGREMSEKHCVDVIYTYNEEDFVGTQVVPTDLQDIIKQCKHQSHTNQHLIVVCLEKLTDKIETYLHQHLADSTISYTVVGHGDKIAHISKNTAGDMLQQARAHCRGEFFTIVNRMTIWHKNHLTRLLWLWKHESNDDSLCVYTTPYIERHEKNRRFIEYNGNVVQQPITMNELFALNEYDVMASSESKYISHFDFVVSTKFTQGCQLFHKNIWNVLDHTLKMPEPFKTLHGSEHLLLLYVSAIHNADSILYSTYYSCALKVESRIRTNSKNLRNIYRYAINPTHITRHTRYSNQNLSTQLYKILVPQAKFWQAYAKYRNNNHIMVDNNYANARFYKKRYDAVRQREKGRNIFAKIFGLPRKLLASFRYRYYRRRLPRNSLWIRK